jgi:transglutaminase-like putative cysteine protease
MMRFRVQHTTRYRYSSPASLCYNLAHLTPRTTERQRVLSSEVVIEPRPDDRTHRTDQYGNGVDYFTIERPHDGLAVTSTCELSVDPYDISPAAERTWESTRDATIGSPDARELLLESPLVPASDALADYAAASFPPGRSMLHAVSDLTARIHRDFRFLPGATTVATPLEQVLELRSGVCQDFAHLAVGCLRAMGLAARYVSGYLETLPPPGEPKLIGADATHAWCAVRLADDSWLDLDPTNDVVGPEHHLVVAWGRDYSDVVPVKGVVMAATDHMELSVAVDVERLGP